MLYNQALVRVCDNCGSSQIRENFEGFTCEDCGMVFEIQRFEFTRPYSENSIQHSRYHDTQIGNKRERQTNTKSREVERLNKIQNNKTHLEKVFKYAREEISRFFSCLQKPLMYEEFVFKKFKTIYFTLKPGTKNRSADILIPFSIYYCLESHNIPITTSEIMEVSKVSLEIFRKFTYEGLNFFPEYDKRDRKAGILQILNELSNSLNLGSDFFELSKILLHKLWNLVKDSKKNVIAGVIAAITTLCFFKGKIRINRITEKLGLGSSTIQKAVKTKIIDRFNISGFKGIVKSSDLLREVLERLNVIKVEENLTKKEHKQIKQIKPELVKYRESTKDDSIADITLITLKASNSSPNIIPNDNKITFLTFHDCKGSPIYIGIKLYDHSYIFKDDNDEYLSYSIGYKLEILHGYFPSKDPPN